MLYKSTWCQNRYSLASPFGSDLLGRNGTIAEQCFQVPTQPACPEEYYWEAQQDRDITTFLTKNELVSSDSLKFSHFCTSCMNDNSEVISLSACQNVTLIRHQWKNKQKSSFQYSRYLESDGPLSCAVIQLQSKHRTAQSLEIWKFSDDV